MQHVSNENTDPRGLVAAASNLLVATADGADQGIDWGVPEVLGMLRHVLKMDVVFVSEFVDGHRVFRHVVAAGDPPVIAPGQSDPLESSWCQRVVDGRLPRFIPDVAALPDKDQLPTPPFEIGTHLSTPVVLSDGRIYGTLCCFSFSPSDVIHEHDLIALQGVADVLAGHIKSPVH